MSAGKAGRWIELKTDHGPVRAWRADPAGTPRGGVLVLQEIFGVNAHMRAVADRFAEAGYVALAPSLFDPVQAGVDLPYDQEAVLHGRALVAELGFDRAVDVMRAAAGTLEREGLAVAAVGYCWGGSLAFLASTRLGLPAVGYYGARSLPFLDEQARAPLMFHFGAQDCSIPGRDIALHREKQPQADVFVYPGAKHAFNRDVDPAAYHAESATLAWQRTLGFLQEHLR